MAAPPRGDQAVFSDIDVRVSVFGYDFVNPDPMPNAGLFPPEPPLLVAVRAVVEINGGTEAGRVPGLRVSGDGIPLVELGSAAQDRRFSFAHDVDHPVHGQSVDIELTYEASSFSLSVAPPVVTITSPAAGEAVAADEPLLLVWTGISAPPDVASATPRIGSCVISYRRVGDATFVPEHNESEAEHELPCRFKMSAEWRVAGVAPSSPFRSLNVSRFVRRIQRFIVQ